MIKKAYLILEKGDGTEFVRSYKLEFDYSLSALASIFVLTKKIDKVYITTLGDELIGSTLACADGFVDRLNSEYIEGGIDNFLNDFLLPYQKNSTLCNRSTLTNVICGKGTVREQLLGIEKVNKLFQIDLSQIFDFKLDNQS